jgi:hypothetical protein
VCVAPGGPARLTPKLVELESAAADVAVLDTSFVAIFDDGRVALYDSDAIAAAGEGGTIQPKYTTQVGGRGEPKTLLLTGKGGSTMWVGTSGGDVITASLLKKT